MHSKQTICCPPKGAPLRYPIREDWRAYVATATDSLHVNIDGCCHLASMLAGVSGKKLAMGHGRSQSRQAASASHKLRLVLGGVIRTRSEYEGPGILLDINQYEQGGPKPTPSGPPHTIR